MPDTARYEGLASDDGVSLALMSSLGTTARHRRTGECARPDPVGLLLSRARVDRACPEAEPAWSVLSRLVRRSTWRSKNSDTRARERWCRVSRFRALERARPQEDHGRVPRLHLYRWCRALRERTGEKSAWARRPGSTRRAETPGSADLHESSRRGPSHQGLPDCGGRHRGRSRGAGGGQHTGARA